MILVLSSSVISDKLGFIGLIVVIVAGLFQIQRTFSDRYRNQLDALEREHATYVKTAGEAIGRGESERLAMADKVNELEKQMAAMPDLRTLQVEVRTWMEKSSTDNATLVRLGEYQREEHQRMIEILDQLVKAAKNHNGKEAL